MENKIIGTGLGTIIIFIVAITVGVFVWMYQKDKKLDEATIAINKELEINKNNTTFYLKKYSSTITKSDDYVLKQDPNSKEIVYINTKYGFIVDLPEEWKDVSYTSEPFETTGSTIKLGPITLRTQLIKKEGEYVVSNGRYSLLGHNNKYYFSHFQEDLSYNLSRADFIASTLKARLIKDRFTTFDIN